MVVSTSAAPPIEAFGPPPHRPALAAQRRGPGVGDLTPGLIIDPPDRDGLRATWDAAARAADPDAIALVRAVVADWPIPWRERWGRLANELAEQGVPHPTDEQRAFAIAVEERQRGDEPPPIHVPMPTESPAEPSAPARWRCTNRFCRDGSRWWMSRWGVVNCLNCVPPSFPESVVARGDLAAAPPVDPCRSKCLNKQLWIRREGTDALPRHPDTP